MQIRPRGRPALEIWLWNSKLEAHVLAGSSAAENRNHMSSGAADRGHLPPGHGSPLCTPVSEVRSREGCPCAVPQFPPCVRTGGRLE